VLARFTIKKYGDAENNNETPTDTYAGEMCQESVCEGYIPTAEGIKQWRDRYNKYRQQSIFGFVFVYLLNSVEAFVDAHLTDFDVSEDISIQIRPSFYNESSTQALQTGIVINF
jgi:hypothetical protein